MLTNEEKKELVFFADKVATVHGPEHGEFVRVNDIIKDIENRELWDNEFMELRELTDNYVVPEWACKAQTTLLNLMKKLDQK